MPDGPSDAGLVHSALGGDVASFSALLDRYRASLYARALAYLGQPEDADQVRRALGYFQPRPAPKPE